MQEGMLFHYLENKDGDQYFEQLALEISGDIQEECFKQAWLWVQQTNEMLGTHFRWEEIKKPVQVILENQPLQVKVYDFSHHTDKTTRGLIDEIKRQDRENRFDLRDIPFRVSLYKLKQNHPDNKYLVLISHHHILIDGWSTGIILKEFLEAYRLLASGSPPPRKEKNRFKEFIRFLQSQDKKKQERFWRDYLTGFETRTPLPVKEKPTPAGGEIKRFRHSFPAALSKELQTFVKQEEITLAALLYTAWGIMLQKYTDNYDAAFGTTVAGRSSRIKDVEHMVGLFINTLPLRVRRTAHTTVSDLLGQVHGSLRTREEYESTSLVDVKKNSRLDGKESLFDTILVIENYPLDGVLAENSAALPFTVDSHEMFYKTNYDLTVEIETFTGITVIFTYTDDRFTGQTISRLMAHFQAVLEAAVHDPQQPVSRLDMPTPEEKRQLLEDFNGPPMSYPRDKTIHQLFEEQAAKTPENTALSGDKQDRRNRLTYRELNIRSARLAHVLRQNGVGEGSVAAVMLEPSVDMVVGLLAILKAGGAYLPITPGLPAERTGFMLEDSAASLVLTDSRSMENLSFSALRHFESNRQAPVTVTPTRGHIAGFDNLPRPDRSLLNLKNYKNKIGMASVTDCISIQTTRGCPFECLFCHKIWSKVHVHRGAENIFNEIEYYYKNGVRNFAFIDDCFNLDRANSSRLFQMIISAKLKLRLFFPNGLRGDIMTPDYIDQMAEAGTRGINLSLETASPRLQKLLKKNLDLDKFKKVVEYIAVQHPGIMLEMASMHGFPTETEDEAMMTLNFIKDIKWLHFPYIHILKIFPNTEMEAFALEHGVSREDILVSRNRAFHELPETLPFPKSFTRQYQSGFMNEYFLSKERLKHVLPVQTQILGETALARKYNAYLPVEINGIRDIIEFAGLEEIADRLGTPDIETSAADTAGFIFDREAAVREPGPQARRILLLDLSQHFSTHHMLYKVAEQPLGLVYLLTYLEKTFGAAIDGRIYKSGNDFDSYEELRERVLEYDPHLIGIRTLTFFREFFHETVSQLRQWGVTAPIITGGPYASSDYDAILKDKNIDLAVLGEGEETLAELVGKMLKTGFEIPPPGILKTIKGIAFADWRGQADHSRAVLQLDRLTFDQTPPQPSASTSGSDLAYVMYTSGSTGAPKGVMVEHSQVNNCIWWMQDKFHLEAGHTIVQRTALTFDPSVWEIFWPLYTGASVKILDEAQRKDAQYLIDLMTAAASEGLTMMYCPASLLNAMTILLNTRAPGAPHPRLTLPWLIIGAEPVKMETIKNFYQYYDGRIVNTYGPTECTINNTWYDLAPGDIRKTVPIGRPVANNQVYILSKDRRLMPIGAPGEIYITGSSTARGYINNPQLTNKSFLRWVQGGRFFQKKPPLAAGGKGYKTGDIGRWLADGTIEIMGRIDEQVKIRGYRIELGEIEKALLKHSAIKDCVAQVRRDSQEHPREKTCQTCGLTSHYPGANIDDRGHCEICAQLENYRQAIARYFKTPAHLAALIEEKNRDKQSPYDCLLLYAGGRGSAYALYQLKDMGFNVLTATYDNGYFGKADLANIKKITSGLGFDHVTLTHPNSDHILKESLQTAHTVCRGCFHTSSSLAADYAYRNNINAVVGATLSRGQIIENKLYLFLKQGITDEAVLEREIAKLQRGAPAMDKNMFDHIAIDAVIDGRVHETVTTVDFYRYFDISNQDMIAYLDNRDPFWKTRKNHAIYSTNCPIKQIGDYAHLRQRGFHFYGSATSWEKRLGHLSLENVAEDLRCRATENAYKRFAHRIGYRLESSVTKDEPYLCAYIVTQKEFTAAEIREYLSGTLPGYMIPAYIIPLPAIPLTPVGKVDRKALPPPDRSRSRLKSSYAAPRGSLEKTIARVWQEILKTDKVGLNDNFFDLGGDSLDIIQVSARLKQELSRDIPVVTIFTFPTVGRLAQNLGEDGPGAAAPPPVDNRRFEEREKGKNRLKQRMRKKAGRVS
jgi:amino acid adenylation domain-containing protein